MTGSEGEPAAVVRRRIQHPAAFWPGLVVGLGTVVATCHGFFEVVVASRVPGGVAWLYPLITDGLALVAYVATSRLTDSLERGYAWAAVILGAGVSGVAQAVYLARPAAELETPAELRFVVGAWPAAAALLTAHLLYLLARGGQHAATSAEQPGATSPAAAETTPAAAPPPSKPSPARRPRTGVPSTSNEEALDMARTYVAEHGPIASRNAFRRITGTGGARADQLWAEFRAAPTGAPTHLHAVPGGGAR